jgi:uncharacterized protein DUF4062
MAQPRVFVSSTYYDLKYVRSSLELFVESLGFEAILSEKGGVPYAPDRALDESCYREVQNCDIYVLIIGGRYGSEASSTKSVLPREFFERYESVTKLEYKAAVDKDVPIYVLIEKAVYAEYQTYQKNRDATDVRYAHVDSVNVYRFMEEILSQPRNNPVQPFDKYSEIEEWLRQQWAGLFRELMLRMSSQQQISTLAAQVNELAEVNKTLRRYLEEVVGKVSPVDARRIIEAERQRLAEATLDQAFRSNRFVKYLEHRGVPLEAIREGLEKGDTLEDVRVRIASAWKERNPSAEDFRVPIPARAMSSNRPFQDLNDAREILGKPRLAPIDDFTEPVLAAPPPNSA